MLAPDFLYFFGRFFGKQVNFNQRIQGLSFWLTDRVPRTRKQRVTINWCLIGLSVNLFQDLLDRSSTDLLSIYLQLTSILPSRASFFNYYLIKVNLHFTFILPSINFHFTSAYLHLPSAFLQLTFNFPSASAFCWYIFAWFH